MNAVAFAPIAIPEEVDPKKFTDHLEKKMYALLAEIEQTEVYQLVARPDTPPPLVAAIVKYILLEVFSYGPHVTEATFTAIGRLPKDRPDLMKPMILHDLSEVDHGEMALKDFIKLGGDEAWARSRRITPESFAMSATCRMLAEREDPFSYLGYMWLFECLTPILTERAQKFLAAKGFPVEAQNFIDTHAEEDIAHADVLTKLIHKVVRDYPASASAIEYGFDCFAAVYPLPIWKAALVHARAEFAQAITARAAHSNGVAVA
jgi:hypothetical protein